MGIIGFSMAGVSIPTLMDVSAFGILWVVVALVVNQHDTNPEIGAAGQPSRTEY
jgi:hypothetical protein